MKDILSITLGPKHPCHVRGTGYGATITSYFHQPRGLRSSALSDEVKRLVDVRVKKILSELTEIVRQQLQKSSQLSPSYYEQYGPSPYYEQLAYPPPYSGHDSCSVSKNLSQISKVILLCNLFYYRPFLIISFLLLFML